MSANFIKKVLKEDKASLIVFDPKTRNANVSQLYKRVKSLVD